MEREHITCKQKIVKETEEQSTTSRERNQWENREENSERANTNLCYENY